jgi:hypothetical protein
VDNLFYIQGRFPEVATAHDLYMATAYTVRAVCSTAGSRRRGPTRSPSPAPSATCRPSSCWGPAWSTI